MRALVLSGGGAKGAYQIGALKYLINDLNRQYDILTGISVGALNVSCLSMFNSENEKQAFEMLNNFWINLENKKVHKRWFPFGKLHALWKKSLYNSQPLIDLVHKTLNLNTIKNSNRSVAVGAVSLDTGEYKVFTKDDHDFVDAVLASSAFPGGLKPIQMKNQLWVDGGIKHITPLKSAIDFNASEIDMIICSPKMTTAKYDTNSKTIGLVLRSIDLMSDQIIEGDLQIANLYNELAISSLRPDKKYIKINVIRPTEDLTENSLNFDNKEIHRMIEIGYKDAKSQYIIK